MDWIIIKMFVVSIVIVLLALACGNANAQAYAKGKNVLFFAIDGKLQLDHAWKAQRLE